MTLVPADITRAVVEDELEGARAWSARNGWALAWLPAALQVRATTTHPATGVQLELVGEFDDYRALPPAWRFVVRGSHTTGAACFPAPGAAAGIPGSIFHNNAVLCAPWNRLAYGQHGGPHGDWTATAWLSIPGTTATTLPDMLAVTNAHLRSSPGMMA